MINVTDLALYEQSLVVLEEFTQGNYYGRLVQIFLACKRYGDAIPRIGSEEGIDTGGLQRLLDDLYEKPSRRPDASVLILFNANHLYPTGVVGAGNAAASNIWRNNFNIQKGFGCFAPHAELQDPAFRAQPRIECPHLRPSVNGQLAGARCEFADNATYRKEDHPKVFRIDPAERDLFVVDPSDTAYYRQFVLAPGERRLPVAPLISALYYDSPLAAGRQVVDVPDFMLDFDISAAEFTTYFDDDPNLDVHTALARRFQVSWTPAAAERAAVVPDVSPIVPIRSRRRRSRNRRVGAPEDLPAVVGPVAPPIGSRWWDAEQAVRVALEAENWHVIDRTRQAAGFDLQARKNGRTFYIEVKSSAGPCAPTLTDNEYAQAASLGEKYVLAIVEFFSPERALTIRWVGNPGPLCGPPRAVQVYPLPRATWMPRARTELA